MNLEEFVAESLVQIAKAPVSLLFGWLWRMACAARDSNPVCVTS